MGQMMANLKDSIPGLGGSNVADPDQSWGNMDSSQRGASVLGGMRQGLGQALQNYGQQQQQIQQRPSGGGVMPMPVQQQPVDPRYFMPQSQNKNFYGGQ